MNNNEQELAEFWDEFAEEYEEIQQESPFQLLENYVISWSKKAFFRVRHFWISQVGRDDTYLFQEQVTEYTLADISQRMLEIAEAKAQSNVVFLHQSQERLIETGKKFQVVFQR